MLCLHDVKFTYISRTYLRKSLYARPYVRRRMFQLYNQWADYNKIFIRGVFENFRGHIGFQAASVV